MKQKLLEKRLKRRLFSVLLVLAMIFSLLPMNSMKVYADDASGDFGPENAFHWDFKDSTKTLTITGTGAMPNFSSTNDAPWYSLANDIATVVIEAGVTAVGDYAFNYSYEGITSVTLPDGLEEIGIMAFRKCSFTSIALPESLTTIGKQAFSETKFTSISFPESLTTIGEKAFEKSALTSVEIPKNVSNYGKSIFYWCESLATVTFESGFNYTNIPEGMFNYCSSLNSITIPASVTSIGKEAFGNCKFTSFTIPTNVISIGERAFSGCVSLKDITIPSSVTSIGKSAFSSCRSLTSITIPSSVTSIGDSAFSSCDNLTDITIPNKVTSIGEYTFSKCEKLSSITIPGSVTSIGIRAFSGCSGLTNITIPSSVTSIGVGAFNYCTNLAEVTVNATNPPTLGENTFSNGSGDLKIYVPQNSVDAYKMSWGAFGEKIVAQSTSTPSRPIIPIIPPSNNGTINGTIAGGETGGENINVNVSGGNATISDIPSSVINNAANTQPNSKEIVIDVSDAGYADVSKVTLTKTTAETIAKVLESSANNKETLTIKSDTATVSIDATALKSIANQAKGNDIQLVVDNKSQGALNASQQGQLNGKVVEKTFEAYFVSGGSRISNFNGGTVTVGKVDFKVPAGKNPKNFHVEYLPTSGAAVRHKTWFADGVLYFDTTHFSDYAIVYDETSANYTYNPIYRLYDPNRGEHVYTYNVAERNHLVGLGWVDETKADGSNSFFGSDIKTEVCNKPVYRVYNPNNGGNHHYTLNKAEANDLVNQGWIFDFEGKPVFYVSTDKNMGVIFYRSYNPNSPSGEHQWARKGEHQALLKKGWEDEGECFVSVE